MIYDPNKTAQEAYGDIINLPHHELKTRKRMPQINRAASFMPFAALTGYDETVKEVARRTDQRAELDEDTKAMLNERLQIALELAEMEPVIKVTYFVPDKKKTGGAYLDYGGTIKRIDEYERKVIFIDKTEIPIDDIYAIDGEIYNFLY